jgi:hypothetical protein
MQQHRMETLKFQRTRLRNAGLSNYIKNLFRLEAAAARTSAGLSQMEVAEVACSQPPHSVVIIDSDEEGSGQKKIPFYAPPHTVRGKAYPSA